MKNIIKTVLTFIIIIGVTYGFLTLINWTAYLQEWSSFSRFILGAEGVIFLLKIIEDL